MRKLNLGCGNSSLAGYINADIIAVPGVDKIFDCNEFPYPFPENSFDEILCNNVLEHLDNLARVMEELYRIGAPNCRILIFAPHFSSNHAFADPTHRHFFAWTSFEYFCNNSSSGIQTHYGTGKFNIVSRKLVFSKGPVLFFNYFMEWLANKIPVFYEGTVLRAFPAEHLELVLEIPKKKKPL